LAPSSIRSLIDRKTSSLWAAASAKSTKTLFRDPFRMPNGHHLGDLTHTGHTTVCGTAIPSKKRAASSVTRPALPWGRRGTGVGAALFPDSGASGLSARNCRSLAFRLCAPTDVTQSACRSRIDHLVARQEVAASCSARRS
jgi:hypothetical protein